MNRVAIFFFYDNNGVVDDYVLYFLKSLKQSCSEIITVVNGLLNDDGYQKINQYSQTILIRENSGFDVYAYKTAIEHIGYENIKSIDELILCNFTFFGPIYPLEEMFGNMDAKQCDIWGPYKDTVRINADKAELSSHILPSFFIVYRNSILNSPFFEEYWSSRPEIKSYHDAIFFHEHKQTLFFEEKGFISDVYIDNIKYQKYWKRQWSTVSADTMIIEDRYPFLKRRHFYINDGTFFNHIKTYGFQKTIKYLQNNTDYDTDLIYKNILRTQCLSELGKNTPPSYKFYKRYLLSKIMPFMKLKYEEKLYNDPYNTPMFSEKDFHKAFDKK